MSIAFWTSIVVLIATVDNATTWSSELLDGEENQYITYIAYLLKTFLKKEGYITDIYFYCGDVFGLKAICTLCSCEGMFVFYDPNCLELR